MEKHKRRKTGGSKGKRQQRYMVYVVALVMLFSGGYMISSTKEFREQAQQTTPPILQYEVERVGNRTAVVFIDRALDELVGVPDNTERIPSETVAGILNSTPGGVSRITAEASNAYILFKFTLTGNYSGNTSAWDDVDVVLKGQLTRHALFSAYDGTVSGRDVYVIGPRNLTEGDAVRVILFQRAGFQEGVPLIGFAWGKVPSGPIVPATVREVGGLLASGELEDTVDASAPLPAGIMLVQYLPPRILVNSTDPELIESLNGLEGVSTREEGNVTVVEAGNVSLTQGVLDETGVDYSLRRGLLRVRSDNASIGELEDALRDWGAVNVVVYREAVVETVGEMTVDGRFIRLENPGNQSALVDVDTRPGDNITIEFGFIYFGQRAIPLAAREVSD